MKRISDKRHIDETIPEEIAAFAIARFDEIVEESDGEVLPIIIYVRESDDIRGSDYAWVGKNGLVSDAYDEHQPGEKGFVSPYEFVIFHKDINLWELLLLRNVDDGYIILVPNSVVEQNNDLSLVLESHSS